MIVVFGSLNVDLVTRVERIAAPGETVIGPTYAALAGGKGANQALAARRAGARVAFVGAIGRDGFAAIARAGLDAAGVDMAGVETVTAPTGIAFVALDAQGHNAITVAAGANASASAAGLATSELGQGDTLLLQREVPDGANLEAARLAQARGARVILNLAPAGPIDPALFALLDVLIMNEHEARALTIPGEPDTVAEAVASRGVTAIVTLGDKGALGWTGGLRRMVAAPPVPVMDTTGAGDAFVGAFAAALDAGLHFSAALVHGVAAGSLACGTFGAQPAIPTAGAIEALVGRMVAADLSRPR